MSTVLDLVHDSVDARDLARRLGAYCLDNKFHIDIQISRVPSVAEIIEHVENLALAVPKSVWAPVHAIPGSLDQILGKELLESLDYLSLVPHIDYYALLRGVCIAALVPWFEQTLDIVELERGDPFPLPLRPNNKVFEKCTAHFPTLRRGELLIDFLFGVYSGRLGNVKMNFQSREELDHACWIDDPPSFPSVALVYPYADGSQIRTPPDEVNVSERWWFGSGPTDKAWSTADILRQLKYSKSQQLTSHPCQVALLPELSLPSPDAMETLIRAHWSEIPELVVLGSAHARTASEDYEFRSNESVVYLNGVELFRHCKRHPFATKSFSTVEGHLLSEGLSPPEHFSLASGTLTRLSVLICVDAMDSTLVDGLKELGVNFLLIPALSPEIGSFNLAPVSISTACQGLCIIVNGVPPGETEKPLFVCIASVPESDPNRQINVYYLPEGVSLPAVGILNPNVSLQTAMSWL